MRIKKSMFSCAYNFLLPVFVLSACYSSAGVQKVEFFETGLRSTLEETLDTYLEANLEDSSPGMAILVMKNDEVSYVGTKGMANKNTGLSITSETGFRLASISKTVTALGIMTLYEQHLLGLDDSIIGLLPELSASWKDITIHHLLTHRSGIPDYHDDPESADWLDGQTNQDVLNYYASHDGLSFEPGTQGDYSNPGYHLLAEIISRASGIRFEDYIADNLFTPLGMANSYVADENTVARVNEALNYAEHTTFEGRNNYTNGANGVVSSLNDLELFMNALLDGRIVKLETLELMLHAHTQDLFPGSHYGYGLMVDPTDVDAFAHAGGHDGFRTWMLFNRDEALNLVILGNGGDQTGNHDYITDLVFEFYDHQ